jgi:phosphoadenosine phosphosulfate reductase
MGAVRLGRISLRWCQWCNVPLVELEVCGACDRDSAPVELTPPGDYRPAFDFDIRRIRETVDGQFGEGVGRLLLPDGHLVVLNKCPGVDAMDEVVCDGMVLGTQVFEPGSGWRYVCRLEGALRIEDALERGWVRVYDDAVPFVQKGASLMAVGVLDADEGIKIGDEVIMVDESGKAIATGRARMTGSEMVAANRNAAVKTRWRSVKGEPPPEPKPATWDDAVRANAPALDERVEKARSYILRTTRRYEDLPVVVSVSGGKDSLATLLLVQDASLEPTLLFIDTGLEFPETIENVRRTAGDLPLLIEEAGDAFWRAVGHFGPPAKDFRWCCKTCKLGPTAKLVRERFPNGVLSFIGQRQYESAQRYEKGNVWRNPWVPGQVGASPIQRWPSLLVWLYLFSKGAEYNPLYERGMERIGCWLCPAADLAELETVKEHAPDWERWQELLASFARERELPGEWAGLGLWRWRVLPKGIGDFLTASGRRELLEICQERKMSGKEEPILTDEQEILVRELSCITGEGNDPEPARRKALYCVGCGICLSLCQNGALRIEGGRAHADPGRCVGCGECVHPCPVVEYSPR